MDEHKIKIEELYKRVRSSSNGLLSSNIKHRQETYGVNVLKSKNKDNIVLKFLLQFKNFFALLLLAGSALAFFAEYISPGEGNLYIAIALVSVVILNSFFTFIQEYQSEKIMESFKKMLPDKAKVLRDGNKIEIKASELVPGDIIFIEEGDKIPADARIIEQNSMKVDNSSITGESEPQLRKTECTHANILESRNMVFSGTTVQSGSATALVYAIGMNTEIGKIVTLTKETKKTDSPLRKEIRHFIKIISVIAIVLGVAFFIISLFMGQRITGSLIFAIGIIVANVPEGLLPTVTLSLSMSARRMAKKNALIKNLESVETLGSTTVICTDKTGTITQNKMSVQTVMFDWKHKSANDNNISKSKTFQYLINAMTLCNNAHGRDEKYIGDPTETSLLSFADKYANIDDIKKSQIRVHEDPFDSKTKRMITINISKNVRTAYLKGAPEVVIEKCSKIVINGVSKTLTQTQKKNLIESYEKLASNGERVLAFAYKKATSTRVTENGFTFIAITGMIDPPRVEVPDAIVKCKNAGIRIIMITGDHSLTAEAIARKVGIIYNDKAVVTTGEELAKTSDEELKNILSQKNVLFARTNPSQKLRIVKCLQSLGEIVTVTGDGVNDAPALKNADMGVAMGLSGTEVAREASNMVLMDDNFATIVNAIEEGRTIYENIKKFIAYILTSNVPEILPFIAFVLLQSPLALTVMLILAIDLGTDLVPALGLGMEKSETDVMKNKPRSRDEKLLSWNLLFFSYGIIGAIQATAGFFSFYYILHAGGWQFGEQLAWNDPLYMGAVTAFFASVVICQVADVFICRTRKQSIFSVGFFSNKLVILGILLELLLLAIIIYLPAANVFFGTAPLTLFELSLSLPFAALIFFGDEIRKYFVRKGNVFIIKYLNW